MRTINMILIGIVAVVLLAVFAYAGTGMMQAGDTNSTTNGTDVNITLNDTDNTTENATQTTRKVTAKPDKSGEPYVVAEYDMENYQAGDGSHFREVKYSDGNVRQYDYEGNLIGSSFEGDQLDIPT